MLNSTKDSDFDWKQKDFLPLRQGRVGQYALDAMAIALNAFYHNKSLDEICCLGGDAEVNGSVFGSLFGSKNGIQGLNFNWVEPLLNLDENGLIIARMLNFL